MQFATLEEIAEKWGITPRQVRSYCAKRRIPGAMLAHGAWRIPKDAAKPERKSRRTFPTTCHRKFGHTKIAEKALAEQAKSEGEMKEVRSE